MLGLHFLEVAKEKRNKNHKSEERDEEKNNPEKYELTKVYPDYLGHIKR